MNELLKKYFEDKMSRYRVLTTFSENKKSKVFLVQDIESNAIYIKKILINYDKKIYERIKSINNKFTPKIYEILEYDNNLILIEEFINGMTLETLLNENNGILSEKETTKYVICLCEILEELHGLENPIIHRDIKPSNIIISNDNVLKLIDYDVSRIYKEEENKDTVIMGTHEYAPPEQYGFSQTDCRSDIYSIGILMNFMTTGDYPKNRKSDGVLKDIIEKCTKFLSDDRYQCVNELKKDLISIMEKDNDRICIQDNEIIEEEAIKNKDYKLDKEIYKYIPGFRTGYWWKSVIACLWYLFLFLIVITIFPTSKTILSDFTLFITLVVLTIIDTNFLNIRRFLPIIKSENIKARILGYILYTIIIMAIGGSVLNLFMN